MLPLTAAELEQVRKKCIAMVNLRATASAVASVVPVPGVDLGADFTIMLELLPAINKKFGLSPKQIENMDDRELQLLIIFTAAKSVLIGKIITKDIVMHLLRKVGLRTTTKQLAKFIPIVGQIFCAGTSFSIIKYLGESHIDECYMVCKRVIEIRSLKSN